MCSGQYVVALAYDKRGKMLSLGRNSYHKTHPLQAKYGALAHRKDKVFLHAEIDALIKAKFKAHRLVITRYGRSGQPLASQPCPVCLRAIMDAGVKELDFLAPTASNIAYQNLFSPENMKIIQAAKSRWANIQDPQTAS